MAYSTLYTRLQQRILPVALKISVLESVFVPAVTKPPTSAVTSEVAAVQQGYATDEHRSFRRFLPQPEIMIALLSVELFDGVAEGDAGHGGGMLVQEF